MGPGDLNDLVRPLLAIAGDDERVLVGPAASDDAGVYLFGDHGLVATADFITPVCDDPLRFGRVAAANSLSDVFAMGGEVLFALNLCCFPGQGRRGVPGPELGEILRGAAEVLAEAGGVLLGGHSVRDEELKFGFAVVGRVDPGRLLRNAGARPGNRLVLTKPLGTGVLINAFKLQKLPADDLEQVLAEMERLNATASRLALSHGSRGATDITGFGLVGHALEMARGSGATVRLRFESLPVFDDFYRMVGKGVTTAATKANRESSADAFEDRAGLSEAQLELLFDPQTSGGLLIAVPAEHCGELLGALRAEGHRAAEVGEVVEGPGRVEAI